MTEVEHVNDLGVLFVSNPSCILISDVHLGGRSNLHPQLAKFLTELNNKLNSGEINRLKVLIITGDFLDVLVDSYRDLAHEKMNCVIHDLLNALTEKGINILECLGNHEVSVFGDFTNHKNEFINKFKAQNIELKFLAPENLCQHIIYEAIGDTTRIIKLYDTDKQLKKEQPFRTIQLPLSSSSGNPYRYFITHGHQFPKLLSFVSGLLFWNKLLKASDFKKEVTNFVWNYSPNDLSEKKVDEALSKWADGKTTEEQAQLNALLAEDSSTFQKILKKEAFSETKKQKLKREMMNKNLIKWVQKAKLQLQGLIYGHSHEQYYDIGVDFLGRQYPIVNIGAWQQVTSPGYAEIEDNGDIKNFHYEIL